MTKVNSLLPDFLIIGTGKSGTTSVYNYLRQHPDLYLSEIKEPNFFAYETIDLSTLDPDALKHYNESITDIKDYNKLFEPATENQFKGEISNTYLVVPGSAERIKYHTPDIKLIAMFRQPIERLYSRFMHLARENRMPTDNFEDALDKDSIWWVRNDLVKEGFYFQNLSRFLNLFPSQNIKIYLTEDLKKDPEKTVHDMMEFIGVEPIDSIDYSVQFNKSGIIKNAAFDKTLGHNSVPKKIIKQFLPKDIYSRLKQSTTLQKIVNNVRDVNLHQPKLDKALKEKMTREIYLDDLKKFETLIDRDLSHWY